MIDVYAAEGTFSEKHTLVWPKGGGKQRSKQLLTSARRLPCLATVVGTSNSGYSFD
jgi:hypothetical protein